MGHKQIGVGAGAMFLGNFKERPADTLEHGGFYGYGGRTDYDYHRTQVMHFGVDRRPMIAHPLDGPFPGPHRRQNEVI
jgi:hypothetical protein